jgi:hypothetical protein
MSRSTLRRSLAATFVAVLAWHGSLRAQDPSCASCQNQASGQSSWGWGWFKPHLVPQVPPAKQEYHTPPVGCWQHHSCDFNCSTAHSEFVFVFGSCREFFGEPCLKGPPRQGDHFSPCPVPPKVWVPGSKLAPAQQP